MPSWSPARVLIALVLGTGVGACFNEPAADVMFACDAAGEAACPVGYACAEDGCCHRDGTEVTPDNFGMCMIGGGQMATSGGTSGGTTMATTTGPTSSSGEATTGVGSTSSTTSGSTGETSTGTTADATGTSETGASTGETDTSTGEMTTGGTTAGETTG